MAGGGPVGIAQWQLKPEVSWVQLLVAAGLFTFLYFRLITFNVPFVLIFRFRMVLKTKK